MEYIELKEMKSKSGDAPVDTDVESKIQEEPKIQPPRGDQRKFASRLWLDMMRKLMRRIS